MSEQKEATREPAGREWLPPAAAAYFLLVATVACVLAAGLLTNVAARTDEPWGAFAALACMAAVAQAFAVLVNFTNAAYSISIAFLLAAAILLPPELALLVPLVQFVPDWLRARREWTIQIFNICHCVVVILAAGGVYRTLDAQLPLRAELRYVVAASAAALVLVLVNHLVNPDRRSLCQPAC